MSTTIYNAYEFLDAPSKVVPFLRDKLSPAIMNSISSASLLESARIYLIPEWYGSLHSLLDQDAQQLFFMLEKIKHKGMGTGYLDIASASCCVFFDKDRTFVKFFNFIDKKSIIADFPDTLTDYSYWNNTDKPATVTESDREERRKFYKNKIIKHGAWDKSSLSYDFMHDENLYVISKLLHKQLQRLKNQILTVGEEAAIQKMSEYRELINTKGYSELVADGKFVQAGLIEVLNGGGPELEIYRDAEAYYNQLRYS